MQRFTDRVAVVTGGAQGIGAATARRLAKEGATVAILDLNAARANETALGLRGHDGQPEHVGLGCDVTNETEVAAAFSNIQNTFGHIDVLVNNAGITRDGLLHKMTVDDWRSVVEINLSSVFLCSREAQRHMVPRRYGKIVNLSSRSALGNRGQANYSAAKAGIQGLTATLAIELGPFDINVNAVAPGFIATAMTAATAERVGSSVEDYQQQVADRTPLRRVGQPEEVAAAIAFLASDDASYVSGQTLYINGGGR
ncbi:3-oxoacyl-ACP reductase FabG [Microbacterium sp. ARD31]|uniref:3-oxoacyl-ACP reductase FabG n=1 Tax=Microbacterium sp. ARD31 TaxID=2962576 RepID=UPI00288228B2|nr:3-oxoacyl-ACP reductase FabG [Microbacterium sp. ARD31]MDT0186067.1 3-oxoacyl-ACP reductase FabG [Microbacterium sp. ARD31]